MSNGRSNAAVATSPCLAIMISLIYHKSVLQQRFFDDAWMRRSWNNEIWLVYGTLRQEKLQMDDLRTSLAHF